MRGLAALALLFAVAVGVEAGAQTYRCQGPDGKTLFTSDRSLCPSAARHEPSGQIQRSTGAPARPAPPRAPAARRAASAPDEAHEAAAWRAKRRQAEAGLEHARARRGMLDRVAGWCNRGGEVYAEDQDGLRQDVSCEDLEAEQQAVRREAKRLEAYLDEGLEEECRRAGCLPGWIR
jgi:hypothetical protein